MQSTITAFDNTAEGWERSLYAFLAEKERHSGSRRTIQGYSRMLQHFFAAAGVPPDRFATQEVSAWIPSAWEEFVEPVRALSSQSKQVHALFNNCYEDKGVVNARQFRELPGV